MAGGTGEGERKNDERLFERAVTIGPYEAEIRRTNLWHEVILYRRVQEFWFI